MSLTPRFVEKRIATELMALSSLALQMAREHQPVIARFAGEYATALRSGGTIFFAGNGGSAADAQHMATEYMIRYSRDRIPLPAIALTTDSSLLTACGNDLGFDDIFARQVNGLMKVGDLLVLHSTSGESANIVSAAVAARSKGVRVLAFLGKGGGRVRDAVDDFLLVPSFETSHIQELHLAIEHVICSLVEDELGLC